MNNYSYSISFIYKYSLYNVFNVDKHSKESILI